MAGIINAISKGRARKAKTAAADKAAKATLRRELYTRLIDELDQASQYVTWVRRTLDNPGQGPGASRQGLRQRLDQVRSSCTGIQIDGSDVAKASITRMLEGIQDLWQEVEEDSPRTEPALTAACRAITTGKAELIDAARTDFGS